MFTETKVNSYFIIKQRYFSWMVYHLVDLTSNFSWRYFTNHTMLCHRICNIIWSNVTIHATLGRYVTNRATSSIVDLMWLACGPMKWLLFISLMYNNLVWFSVTSELLLQCVACLFSSDFYEACQSPGHALYLAGLEVWNIELLVFDKKHPYFTFSYACWDSNDHWLPYRCHLAWLDIM